METIHPFGFPGEKSDLPLPSVFQTDLKPSVCWWRPFYRWNHCQESDHPDLIVDFNSLRASFLSCLSHVVVFFRAKNLRETPHFDGKKRWFPLDFSSAPQVTWSLSIYLQMDVQWIGWKNLQRACLSIPHMGKIPWNSRWFPCRLNPLRCGFCSSGWGSAEGRERSWAEVNISCDIHVANILPNILAYITYINIYIDITFTYIYTYHIWYMYIYI